MRNIIVFLVSKINRRNDSAVNHSAIWVCADLFSGRVAESLIYLDRIIHRLLFERRR
jgi:hypothetical protein